MQHKASLIKTQRVLFFFAFATLVQRRSFLFKQCAATNNKWSITPQMRNVFPPADLKKSQTNQGNLGGSNLQVAAHFLAKFYHYCVLIHKLCTFCWKKEDYRTDPGNEIASRARNSQKRNYLKGHLGIWSNQVTLFALSKQHKASRNSHQLPCRVSHIEASLRVPTLSSRATALYCLTGKNNKMHVAKRTAEELRAILTLQFKLNS